LTCFNKRLCQLKYVNLQKERLKTVKVIVIVKKGTIADSAESIETKGILLYNKYYK